MKEPWYKEGLDFKCKGCSGCCRGFSGFVWITQDDIANISSYLKITKSEFIKKYTEKAFGRITLKELPSPGFECVFLKDKKCSIYPVRPYQCISFPFWPQNLESPKAWKENVNCLGINAPTKHYSFEEIEIILEKHKSQPY